MQMAWWVAEGLLLLPALQRGKERHKYCNIRCTQGPDDQSVWHATLFPPGRGTIVVGQHNQQFGAACIADAAAVIAKEAGVNMQLLLNFDPKTRRMVRTTDVLLMWYTLQCVVVCLRALPCVMDPAAVGAGLPEFESPGNVPCQLPLRACARNPMNPAP